MSTTALYDEFCFECREKILRCVSEVSWCEAWQKWIHSECELGHHFFVKGKPMTQTYQEHASDALPS